MGKTKASLSPIHRSSPCFLRNRTPVCGTVVTEDMAESWPTGGTLQMLIHLGGAWTRVPIPATYKQSGAADSLLLTVPLNNASYKPAPQEKLKKKKSKQSHRACQALTNIKSKPAGLTKLWQLPPWVLREFGKWQMMVMREIKTSLGSGGKMSPS